MMEAMYEAGSICTMAVGGQRFGIETGLLAQVIGRQGMRRVPLAPAFVCGVLPYRGEVLTVVGMRSLLQVDGPACKEGCVLVVRGESEQFGLLVDEVGEVVEGMKPEAMPAGAGARAGWLFGGVWRMKDELVAILEPARLSPARLRGAMNLFAMGARDEEAA